MKFYSREDMEEGKFLVYILLNLDKPGLFKYGELEFDYEPLYVGQGNKRRPVGSRIEGSRKNFKCSPVILHINLPKQESLEIETSYIRLIGRLHLKEGPLLNDMESYTDIYKFSIQNGTHVSQFPEIGRETVRQQLLAGTHISQNPIYVMASAARLKAAVLKQLAEGTHISQDKEALNRLSIRSSKAQDEAIEKGYHHNCRNDKTKIDWIRNIEDGYYLTGKDGIYLGDKRLGQLVENFNKLLLKHNILDVRLIRTVESRYRVIKDINFNVETCTLKYKENTNA